MKETCLKRSRASSPLKQEVQPSVTMWKKQKKEEKRNQFLTSVRGFLTVWNLLKVIEK